MALVIKTQLIPPKLSSEILTRHRLLKILQENLDKKLILITAGAGYGKTTLVTQFVSEIGRVPQQQGEETSPLQGKRKGSGYSDPSKQPPPRRDKQAGREARIGYRGRGKEDNKKDEEPLQNGNRKGEETSPLQDTINRVPLLISFRKWQ